MSTQPRHRRRRKIRRTGRHTTPSQVEKVAQTAGKAVPAVAVVGALAAAPQVHDFTHAGPAAVAEHMVRTRHDTTSPRAVRVHTDATGARTAHIRLDAATRRDAKASRPAASRRYEVRAGDTLSEIAARFYGHASAWHRIYHANRAKVSDPNLIYPGQMLVVPHMSKVELTAHWGDPRPSHHHHYRPRHARPDPVGEGSGSGLSGTLGCGGLEHLWMAAGGAPSAAVTAASVAMAESGGDQFAVSPTDDIGYWQINAPSWGSLASTDPMTNAHAAVQISSDGTNWSPWTTFNDGAYAGRC